MTMRRLGISVLAATLLAGTAAIGHAQTGGGASASTVGTGGASVGAGGASGTIATGGSAAAGGTSASSVGTGGTSTGAAGTGSSLATGSSAAGGKTMSRTKVNENPNKLQGHTKAQAHDGGTFSKTHTKTKVKHGEELTSRTKTMAHTPGSKPVKSTTRTGVSLSQ